MTSQAPKAEDVAPWIERLARVGYAAKAILYITVGILAAQAGLGRGGRTTDTHGALEAMYGVTWGRLVVMVIAAGLLGYAVWRLVEAVFDADRRGTSLKGIALRVGSVGRALFYGAFGIAAVRLALGLGSDGSSTDARHWTARAFQIPAGELLVWAAAIGISVYGLYQMYRAYVPKLGRQLQLHRIPEGATGFLVGVSRFGIAARGVVFCLIGLFLARAAAQHDPAEAGGLRKSLGTVASWGRWPFVVVALGLISYGVYQLINARYRRIQVA